MSDQEESNRTRAHVFISGRVQGVNFRSNTQRKAHQLDLTGWVRNLWDGRVEVVFEGKESAVRQAISWCREGEPPARVEDVDVDYEDATGEFDDFRIAWSA